MIGVFAILAFEPASTARFLLVERAFVSGYGRRVRIYDADCTDATDVSSIRSLLHEPFKPVRRTLLADLAGIDVSSPDNFEGITWGPGLITGERTLLLVSDNDFRAELTTRVIALRVRRRTATSPGSWPLPRAAKPRTNGGPAKAIPIRATA